MPGGAEELAKHFDIKIYAEEHEKETLDTPSLNLSGWEGVQKTYHADVFLKNEQEIDLAGFHIRVFHTPGHTVGGCCYYFPVSECSFFRGHPLLHIGGTHRFSKGQCSTDHPLH